MSYLYYMKNNINELSSIKSNYYNKVSWIAMIVVVFHFWIISHLYYNFQVILQNQNRVKLNRVFFPRC